MDEQEFCQRFKGRLTKNMVVEIFFKGTNRERGDFYHLAQTNYTPNPERGPYLSAFNEFHQIMAIPLENIKDIFAYRKIDL